MARRNSKFERRKVDAQEEDAMTTICRSYTFEAAHQLPNLPEPMHKCKRMHGHSYRVEVRISGEPDKIGMVRGIEFEKIDVAMEPIIAFLDHYVLNHKIENPTVENIAKWFCERLFDILVVPITVRVYEGPRSWAQTSIG